MLKATASCSMAPESSTGGRANVKQPAPAAFGYTDALAVTVTTRCPEQRMGDPAHGEVTRLLRMWRQGDRSGEARLFELVLPDLRRLAGYHMRRERAGHTLAPTALLNETYLRLVGARNCDWQDRRHFFAVAARAMRRYLIDYARARPKASQVSIEADERLLLGDEQRIETALAVDRLLDALEREYPDQCAVVELKFFLGLTDEEAAETLGTPLRTVQRRWQAARQWLYERSTAPRSGAAGTRRS